MCLFISACVCPGPRSRLLCRCVRLRGPLGANTRLTTKHQSPLSSPTVQQALLSLPVRRQGSIFSEGDRELHTRRTLPGTPARLLIGAIIQSANHMAAAQNPNYVDTGHFSTNSCGCAEALTTDPIKFLIKFFADCVCLLLLCFPFIWHCKGQSTQFTWNHSFYIVSRLQKFGDDFTDTTEQSKQPWCRIPVMIIILISVIRWFQYDFF